jgi:hypothetical protein
LIDFGQFAMIRFNGLEPSLDMLPLKGIITDPTSPLIVIVSSAYREDTEINGAGTTEPKTSREIDFAIMLIFLWDCFVPPIEVGIQECDPFFTINPQTLVGILSSSFDEENLGFLGCLRETRSDGASGRTTYIQVRLT